MNVEAVANVDSGRWVMHPELRRQLAPRERLSTSQWAVKNFTIREKGATQPGPYDLTLTPYWREALDAMGDPAVRWVNLVASAQTGKTQLGNVAIAYWADQTPTNMLYVRPAEPDVIEAFRDRFRPMIEANLRHLIPSGAWMNTGSNPVIILNSCLIYGAAATIARHMTSRTTLKVLYDETDTAEDSANSLGNVLSLLDERQMAGSGYRAITAGMSTPKFETGANWQAYDKRSDRREYYEPCPFCGHYQPLVLARIKVPGDDKPTPHEIRASRCAVYYCEACNEGIPDSWQAWMADRGVWVPAECSVGEALPVDNDEIVARSVTTNEPSKLWEPHIIGPRWSSPHRGYRVWRANTKFQQCSWSNILATWFEVGKDPTKIQVFRNNWQALPFKQAIDTASDEIVRERIGEYEPRTMPSQARILLAGCDVQTDCLWFVARAFGVEWSSWLVDYGRIEVVAQDYESAFAELYKRLFVVGYPLVSDREMHVRSYALAVDSGFRTADVYDFALRPGVVPVKGQDTAAYRVKPSFVEGKNTPQPVQLWHVNTKAQKDRLQRMMRTGPGEIGEWHLHRDTSPEYIDQVTAEHLTRKTKNSVLTYQPKSPGAANHIGDCEVYTLALTEILEQAGEVRIGGIQETDPTVGTFPAASIPSGDGRPSQAPVRKKKRRGGGNQWLDGPGF